MSKNALKRWAVTAGIMATSTVAFAGVTVNSPANGATSGSPVHFVASASSSRPISAITIYVDGNAVTTVQTASIDTSIPIAAGQHSVVVQAWDTAGTVMKSVETINVTAG